MPPSSQKDCDNNRNKIEPYYTNEDVEILHEIVVQAEELLPTLPERDRVPTNALFHAYYAILPTLGLQADHDNRYARVLFKIGGNRSSTSLYKKFEAVLSRMGIEIQYDQDISHGDNDRTKEVPASETLHSQPDYSSALGPLESRGRRRSESSIWETAASSRGRRISQHRSHSLSRAISTISSGDIYGSNISVQATEEAAAASDHDVRPKGRDQAERKEQNITAWLNTSLDRSLQRSPIQSTSAHENIPIEQRSSSTTHAWDAKLSLLKPVGGREMPSHSRNIEEAVGIAKIPFGYQHPLAPGRTPEILLDTKATFFGQYRARNLVRSLWVQWRGKALELQKINRNLDLSAKKHDKGALFRQAIFSWRSNIALHKREAETVTFFAHLGRRADRARDLFLLTKALTHWANSASDEAQRTSIARRHVLRKKYFDSWLEITAINELKVRRQIIGKFFVTWKKRYIRITPAISNAVVVFEECLAKKVFWVWIRNFYERITPRWWAMRERRRIFNLWLTTARASRADEIIAIDHYQQALRQRFQLRYITKLRQDTVREDEALTLSAFLNCRKRFIHWHHQLAFLPVLHKLQYMIAIRLKRESIGEWLIRVKQKKQEKQAKELDQLKITREAWATWIDRVRCQAFRSRINDRIVLQGLYRWVLKERLILARRLLDRRLIQRTLLAMALKSSRAIERERENTKLAQYFADSILINRTVRRLRSRLEIQLQHYYTVEYRLPKVLKRFLIQWANQTQRMSGLHEWAHNAEFFFLTGKTLKRWQEATVVVKREKRRKIYKQTRRRYRINHASGFLSVWRNQAKDIVKNKCLAADIQHSRTVTLVQEIFERWKSRTTEIMVLEPIWEKYLLRKHVYNMKRAFLTNRIVDIDTTNYFREHTLSLVIKSWGRAALQHRARQYLATELRERHEKKLLKKIISYWNQRSSETQPPIPDLTSRKIPYENIIGTAGGTEMFFSFGGRSGTSAWASRTMKANTSVPLPEYLSTPKKSSGANLQGKYSTTPSAPLSTPFEKYLRGQYRRLDLPLQETGVKHNGSLYSKDIKKY